MRKVWKLDICHDRPRYIGLYWQTKTWYGRRYWKLIDYETNRADLIRIFERLKDLPEYLP